MHLQRLSMMHRMLQDGISSRVGFFLIKSHIWNMNFVEDDAGNIPTTVLAQLWCFNEQLCSIEARQMEFSINSVLRVR